MDEPETERSCFCVAAIEKTSDGWADAMVCVWRYCFDYSPISRVACDFRAAEATMAELVRDTASGDSDYLMPVTRLFTEPVVVTIDRVMQVMVYMEIIKSLRRHAGCNAPR